jgi:hypothetical protein
MHSSMKVPYVKKKATHCPKGNKYTIYSFATLDVRVWAGGVLMLAIVLRASESMTKSLIVTLLFFKMCVD